MDEETLADCVREDREEICKCHSSVGRVRVLTSGFSFVTQFSGRSRGDESFPDTGRQGEDCGSREPTFIVLGFARFGLRRPNIFFTFVYTVLKTTPSVIRVKCGQPGV